MIYEFEYDEITCCSDCPFFYDLIVCLITDREDRTTDYTWDDDGKRPVWCPLVEERLYYELSIPIKTGDRLDGSDCPAEKCSVCGELFEEGACFCSNCGRLMVRNA